MIIAQKKLSVWALSNKKAQRKLDHLASLWFEHIIEGIKDDYKNLKFASLSPLKVQHGCIKHTALYGVDVLLETKPEKVVVQRLVVAVKKPKPEVVKKTPKKVYKKTEKKAKKATKAKNRDSKGRFIKKK